MYLTDLTDAQKEYIKVLLSAKLLGTVINSNNALTQ